MPRLTGGPPISPYERAVCYYTLPKVTHPVTLGLIAIYAVCVLEAIAALAYGLYTSNMTWTTAGAYAFAGIVTFGVVAFFVRALLNEVRERKALAEAHRSPMLTPAEDLPDPFAEHVLLRHPAQAESTLTECSEAGENVRFRIERAPARRAWHLRTPEGDEVLRVQVLRGVQSFSFSMNRPRRMAVFRGAIEIARIERHGGLGEIRVEINSECLAPRQIIVRNRGIYVGGALVGRLYTLRKQDYLDVHRDVLNDALLGYFATLS